MPVEPKYASKFYSAVRKNDFWNRICADCQRSFLQRRVGRRRTYCLACSERRNRALRKPPKLGENLR